MRPDADLIDIVFASGSADLNRALIERMAATDPPVPLYVVAEFEPAWPAGTEGKWIPYHVLRGFRENLASVRAGIGEKHIRRGAIILDARVPLRRMRLIAWTLARGPLTVYDCDLNPVSGTRWATHFVKRVTENAGSPRVRHWLRRMRHPAQAEIPVRARAAQFYGVVANRIRSVQHDVALEGCSPLADGVSVVVPSRNGRELLESMLPALVPQVERGEIIVSDNGSSDDTEHWLRRHYPAIRVIRTEQPLSFSRAVNLGIKGAGFSRTLLLNNDMVVQPDFVQALNSAFHSIPDLFCATAQIFFPPGIRREETGKAVWRREHPQDFPVRCDEPVTGEDLTWVLYGSGGCSLFDTEKLRALGGVSEVFDPAYVEDLDLGYRAWKRGWPSVFRAGAQVEHRHRATTSRYYTPEQLDAFVERNYLRFLIHAIGSPALFTRLWLAAIRRLQLNAMAGNTAALEALRHVPKIGPRPTAAQAKLSETEILALGNGDVAVFQGRPPTNRPIVIVASPYLPYPLSHGGAVRIYNLMRHAATEVDHVLIAFCDELTTPFAELLQICHEVILVRRHGSHYRKDTPLPDAVEEFNSETFRACLKQTVRRWSAGIVQLEFTQMAQFAEDCLPARTLLVEHDITFDLQEQLLATTTETGAARWEQARQLDKWRTFERNAWATVDCVVTVSPKDERIVAGARTVTCIPNGVDTERFHPSETAPERGRLLFIGSFAHLPNLLALEWFLREIWPQLGSGFALHIIAGARYEYFLDFYRTRARVDLSAPGIEVEGFVSDVRDAYRRAEIVIAPLTASAGTNIKVLEAMAMGRAVVSTTPGINGLDLSPAEELLIADQAGEFAAAVVRLSSQDAYRRNLEKAARNAALRFEWKNFALAQTRIYRTLISA